MHDHEFAAIIQLHFGPMGIDCTDEVVHEFVFLPPNTAERAPRNRLAEHAANVLRRWIDEPERPHALPTAECGTPFQRRVWAAISAIPRGHTRSYGELAHAIASAPRAVGMACGANPFPLIVPCHRVVARTGLGGFAGNRDGHLIQVKQWLLDHEAKR